MEEGFLVPHADPVLKSWEEVSFFDEFVVPKLCGNCVEMFEDLVLAVFEETPDTIFFILVHDNFGAANFFRSQFKRLVKVVWADFVLNEGFKIL